MANKLDPSVDPLKNGSSDSTASLTAVGTTINAPELKKDGDLKLDVPSVGTTQQAWNICKNAEVRNAFRSKRAAAMARVYDGEPVVSPVTKMSQAGSWQSNVNFRTLTAIVDRKVQRMIGTINAMAYLTKSALPPTFQDYKRKSESFQAASTRMMKSWAGWKTFLQQTTQQNVLQGYCAATFLNAEDWHPEFFDVEHFYVPNSAGQNSADLQFMVIKKDIMLNEFLAFFMEGGEQVAEDLGWKLEECKKAANKSILQNKAKDALTTEYTALADMIRDGTLGLAEGGDSARVIETYYLLSREYDNQVSLWIIERQTGKLLRFSYKIYKKFQDASSLFSLQPGNGSLHSSQGLGRQLIGPIIAIEKVKNQAVDNTLLASLRVLTTDAAGQTKMQPKVVAPFIILDKGVTLSDSGFNANTRDLTHLDTYLSANIEQAAGAYAGTNLASLESTQKTATGEKIQAAAQQESADATEARYASQFADLITNIQRLAFSDDNMKEAKRVFVKMRDGKLSEAEVELELSKGLADKEAAKAVVEMYQNGLQDDEIKILRSKNASGLAYLDDAINSAAITTIASQYGGDPRLDQQELLYRNILQIGGPDLARLLVIPGIDQTIITEATRMQMTEIASMITYSQDLAALVPGVNFQPSPRDNHMVHLDVLKGVLEPAGTMITTRPELATKSVLKTMELMLNHANQHIELLIQKDNSDKAKETAGWFSEFQKKFMEAVQVLEAQKVHAERVSGAVKEATATPQITDPSVVELAPAV